jgi:hypothetical protein
VLAPRTGPDVQRDRSTAGNVDHQDLYSTALGRDSSLAYPQTFILSKECLRWGARGRVVVKALSYKPEGRVFDTR